MRVSRRRVGDVGLRNFGQPKPRAPARWPTLLYWGSWAFLPVAIGCLLSFHEVEAQQVEEAVTIGESEPQRYDGFSGYRRPVTCDVPEAQTWFDQGIQLLYGYNHDEAIRSFEEAARVDPSCAMAWWGSAYARGLHINNPEMTEEQSRLAYEASRKALQALDEESPAERALIEAVSERYAWPAPEDRAPLDQAYADAMEQVWHRFPEDPDVGALYAESLMNLQPWDLWTGEGKPKGRTLEICGVLEHTLAYSPVHPGANHFYIHAIEASPWPELGEPSAERLTDLVPGSGHLVHMPSHIFIRVGRYAEAAGANQRAIAADEAYFSKAPPPKFYSLYFLHNIHFLAYAAMMEGRYELAMNSARKIEKQLPEEVLREYVEIADGFMSTSLLVMIRFGKWEEILEVDEPQEWRIFSRAERHYARAVALANLRRIDQAEQELEQFDLVAEQLTDKWMMGNNPATDVLRVARKMAEGELQYFRGEHETAFDTLRHAVALEEQLSYDEPPGWMQPVRHALGALLLAEERAAEAEVVYREDLKRHPNNAWSLLGLKQAFERQGKHDEAERLAPQVEAAWARADVSPMASCYCHPREE